MQELTRHEIDDLLRGEFVGRIGCRDGGETYVVPVIYAYDGEALYAYSVEGRKIRAMRSDPKVCFEVDRYDGQAPGAARSAGAATRSSTATAPTRAGPCFASASREQDAGRGRPATAACPLRFASSSTG